ncbi:protein C3orf33 homolog isoform X4 [Salvelinus alpinus]|uniref:protein C3orf33 homolog isoform X4 n=1 Tax=Salvelinus alpinus TaxID=8036 RepID=UPI0039FD7D46
MADPLLAKGMADPLLAKGMADPLLAKGMADPLLAKGMADPLLAKGMADPLLAKGMEDPLLAKGMADPLLAKGGGRVYPLAVRLAGVELTPEGRAWLEQHLSPAQTVWLKLVSREEETLHCLVSVSRGSLRSLCLNEEVLRLGLARTVPVSGLHPQSHLYLRLNQRLLKAEVKAERKGRGMWKEDSLWERTSQAVWDNSLVRLIRRIFKWT